MKKGKSLLDDDDEDVNEEEGESVEEVQQVSLRKSTKLIRGLSNWDLTSNELVVSFSLTPSGS